jgi:citrate synthase
MAMNARSASSALRAFRVGFIRADSQQPLAVRPAVAPACRNYATSSEPDLKTTFKEVLPAKRELLKKVKALSDKKIGDVKVENTLGGMR